MGKPTKLTPDVQQRILQAIQMGATYGLAAAYGGVSMDSFARWRDKIADFADAIKEAEGKAVVGWLAKIEKAANEGAWQAAAWKLERRYPKDYGRQMIEHSGPNGKDIPLRVTEVIIKHNSTTDDDEPLDA